MRRLARYGIIAATLAVAFHASEAAAQGDEQQQPSTPERSSAATLRETLRAMLGRPGGLASDDVAKQAAATSFDVRARMGDLQSAAAAVDEALIAYFPRLELTGRYTRLSNIKTTPLGTVVVGPEGPIPPGAQLVGVPLSFPFLLNQYNLQASLSVPFSDYLLRLPQQHAAATHSERGAALSVEASKLNAAADARALYYTWARAKLQLEVSLQAVAQTRQHHTDAVHAFDAGTASKADVLRLESQVAQAELLVERSRSLVEVSEAQLHVVMHDEKQGAYEIGEHLEEETVPFPGGDVPLTAMWQEARARRLELQSLTESANAQRERAKVARAGYWPRLDGFADATYANPNSRYVPAQEVFKGTWDAGIQLTIVPNDIANAAPNSRSFEGQAAKALADREAFFDGIRGEVAQAREDRRVALASLETTRRGLTSAEESYRVRSSLFQHGRATAVELTDAETDLTRARLDSINARIDLRITTVRLVHALGRDVAQVNGSPR